MRKLSLVTAFAVLLSLSSCKKQYTCHCDVAGGGDQHVKVEASSKKKAEAEEKVKAEIDKKKAEADAKIQAEKERLQKEIDARKKAAEDSAKKAAQQKAKDALKDLNPFKKK